MKLAETKMTSGLSFQQELLLQALERQALTGRLMTNPRVTGFSSFAKAVLNFINDKKAPKTCKNLYNYLLKNGYYDKLETRLTQKGKLMSRIRLNSEYRNKGAVRFREHLEQENTQEKEAYLQERE